MFSRALLDLFDEELDVPSVRYAVAVHVGTIGLAGIEIDFRLDIDAMGPGR
jgi:hypothetical protein